MPRAISAEWDEDDVAEWVDDLPARRLRRKPLPWLRMILISACSIAGLVYFALEQEQSTRPAVRQGAVPSSVLVAPAPAWKALPPSQSAYTLANTSGAVTSEAREHANGAREDTLTLGRFGDFRYAQLALLQGPAEPAGSFYIETVRRAARSGLAVAHQGQSQVVATKFGAVEAAPMTLANKGEQVCQAFRFSDPTAEFSFQGWLCGSAAPDAAQLACFLDGLVLSGSPNPSLKAIFAQAERNRTDSCAPSARSASVTVRPPTRP